MFNKKTTCRIIHKRPGESKRNDYGGQKNKGREETNDSKDWQDEREKRKG